jgi:4-hydroxy-3-methylbut-2-enyl diphosphate reductase
MPKAFADKPPLRILLAAPRGFCAGVDRAIRVVEEALRRYGAPVYVRHEIVHNRTVVERLEAKGAVFVDELGGVPDGGHVVFSAHGVPKSVPDEARRRALLYVDATCPLVSKVHREAERHFSAARHVLMIGHAGHPEVEGTMGQLPAGAMTLVQDADEARTVCPPPGKHEDICYATTNRQAAVKAIASGSDLVLVIGSPNSSNSQRLREVAERSGAGRALLLPRPEMLDWTVLDGVEVLGISAGASAPEELVGALLRLLGNRYALAVEERRVVDEDVVFRLPAPLA